jgi:DNA repair protein RecO (recombination protein O)
MFIHYRTQGIVLKKEERGESDQLFTVFTKDFGKLEILGKGIRKITSKLRAGIEIFYLSEIEFVQGKNQKILTDAISIKKFEKIRKNLLKLKIAYKISEVLSNLIKGEERDEKIWLLLKDTFSKLEKYHLKNERLKLIYYYFFWNLISFLGYRPQLYFCFLCERRLRPQKIYFSKGGILCENCFRKNKEGILITPETVKILREILKQNWQILKRLKIEKKHLRELQKISKFYLEKVLENQ